MPAMLMVFSLAFAASPKAQAEDMDELNARVEETAVRLNEAQTHLDDIENRIAENKETISNLQVQIEKNKENNKEAMCNMYRHQRSMPALVQLIVSSGSVSELYGTIDFLQRRQESYMETMQAQADAKRDLEAASEQLAIDKEQAKAAVEDAQEAMEEAQAVREEAMKRAAEEAARQLAEEQARQAREVASQQANSSVTVGDTDAESTPAAMTEGEDAGNDSTNVDEQETTVVNDSIGSDDVTWTERDEFVATWAARIDNYLAGSPLSGYGKNFAEAAWNYGVDPRWSPAISCVESGKGAVCYRSYNAWGWGGISYGSWEEAIDAHVGGLSRGYGHSLTIEAAQKYCPPTYESWYNRCLEEMSQI